jgi:hydrogenase maturation protein HypF
MPGELKNIRRMLEGGLNAPVTSSAGRLFDAVASTIGLRQKIAFEGQAAMELEFLVDESESGVYEFELAVGTPIEIDWEPMIHGIISDTLDGLRPSHMAAKFHNTLSEIIVRLAILVGESSIVLSGGCFQNRYLLERAVNRLRESGFSVYWHQRVPTNDGGIALGQTVAAAITLHEEAEKRRTDAVCV